MRLITVLLLTSVLLFSCNSADKIPDVSSVKIELSTQRFDQDFFGIDSTNFAPLLDKLEAKYMSFGENFVYQILQADPHWPADTVATYVGKFASLYRPIYDSSQLIFKDFSPYEKEIKKSFQYLRHYFPDSAIPKRITTFIGPLDGTGMAIADDSVLCVGLHAYLGKNFSLYKSALVQETYPEYVTSRFEPGYIAIDGIKLIMQNMYPENLEDKPLVQQMVEKGKRLYMLSKILPYTEEYKLIGYTKEQMADTYVHERNVWDLFVQNNLLQTIDNNIIKNYIGDSPKTQELGEGSPGNVGSFAGWQIVKKYMLKNPNTSLKQLMETDAETIFAEAKYKP